MLRAIDEYDGAGVYIRKLLDALLELDRTNQYVLLYARPRRGGTLSMRTCARWCRRAGEAALGSGRRAARRTASWPGRPVSPQFSIPVVAPCPTVVQQRGTEYWSFPEYYQAWGDRVNRLYNKWSIPLFCRRATRVLTNSDSLASGVRGAGGCPCRQDDDRPCRGRRGVHPGDRSGQLARVRSRYQLPTSPSSSWS